MKRGEYCTATPAKSLAVSILLVFVRSVLKLLCDEKAFNRDRVSNALKRLKKARSVGNQKRMDSFFSFGGAKKDPFAAAAAAGAAGGSSSSSSSKAKKPSAGAKKVGGVKRSITSTDAKSRKK